MSQALRQRVRWTQNILFLVLALILLPAANYGQDDDVIKVETELVVLNLTVTDHEGAYVPDLEAKDFKIYEDGTEVPRKLINSFSVQESPFAAVILLDTSGSMESRLSLGRSAAIRFLDGLRPEDVAAVYRFDSKVESIQDFSSGRDLAPIAFGIRAKGMTTLNDAIVEAAKALAGRQEMRKAIVVLSDGIDTYSKSSSEKALASALAVGATIYTVDMSDSENRSSNMQNVAVLKNYAEKSGGRFIKTPGGPGLRDAFASIVEELGHQYTITFRPQRTADDGRWHSVDVKSNGPEFIVRTRKGYRAKKG